MAGIRALPRARFKRQRPFAIRDHLAVVVLPEITIRTSVITEHRGLEHELLQLARAGLGVHRLTPLMAWSGVTRQWRARSNVVSATIMRIADSKRKDREVAKSSTGQGRSE